MNFIFPQHLYCITARQYGPNHDVVSQVEAMLKGGAKIIQYRDKELPDDEFEKIARELLRLMRQFKDVIFLVNDRVEIAARIGADGAHVGWEDLQKFGSVEKIRGIFLQGRGGFIPPGLARHKASPIRNNPIIGISTHSVEQACKTERMGADYVGIGPVFATPTKPDYKPIGLDVVREVARLVKIPVVAIGGIDENNFREVLKCGVEAVAMVRGICDPGKKGIANLKNVEAVVERFLKYEI